MSCSITTQCVADSSVAVSVPRAHLPDANQPTTVYEYMCHLHELKQWLETVLDQELPPVDELEESLRHGVYLARLALKLVPGIGGGRVYDADLTRYNSGHALHFRHTDNINLWLSSLHELRLPAIFHPTTTDVFDAKNLPKAVFCLHAQSVIGHRLGRTPAMPRLVGRLHFSASQLTQAQMRAEASLVANSGRGGVSLPLFSQIDRLLGAPMAELPSVSVSAANTPVIALSASDSIDSSTATNNNDNNKVRDNTIPQQQTSPKDPVLSSININGQLEEIQPQHERTGREEKWKFEEQKKREEKEKLRVQERAVAAVNRCLGEAAGLMTTPSSDSHVHYQELEMELMRQLELLGLSLDSSSGGDSGGRLCEWAAPLFLSEMTTVRVEGCGRDLNAAAITGAIQLIPALAAVNRAIHTRDTGALCTSLSSTSALLMDVDCSLVGEYLTALRAKVKPSVIAESSALDQCDDTRYCRVSGTILLSHQTVQQIIDETNAAVDERRRMDKVLAAVNTTLTNAISVNSRSSATLGEEDDQLPTFYTDELCRFLSEPPLANSLSLKADTQSRIHCCQIMHDLALLRQCQQISDCASISEQRPPSPPELSTADIEHCAVLASQHSVEAHRALDHLCRLNFRIDRISESELEQILADNCLALRHFTPQLSAPCLSRLRHFCRRLTGDESASWIVHCLADGYRVFFRLSDRQLSWQQQEQLQQPASSLTAGSYIDQNQLQALISSVTKYSPPGGVLNDQCADEKRQLSNHDWLVRFQAVSRGYLQRRRMVARRRHFQQHSATIVALQARWRGVLQRRRFTILLSARRAAVQVERLRDEVETLRRRNQWETELLQRFQPHVRYVVVIQRFWRSWRLRASLGQLGSLAKPTVTAVRPLLHLLDVSGADFGEELLVQKLKGSAVQLIRQNRQLEQRLDELDVKIGLLVKHQTVGNDALRSLQTPSSSCVNTTTSSNSNTSTANTCSNKKTSSTSSSTPSGFNSVVASQTSGLKSFTRDNRERLCLYQRLFYLLQTEPAYLVRLVFALPAGHSARALDTIVFSVYGYGSHAREQYWLMCLMELALREEVFTRAQCVGDVATGQWPVLRLIVQYCRRHSLAPLLAPLVAPVVNDRSLKINTSPVDVYRLWINEQEAATGQPCGLPYNVSADEALQHVEVRRRIASSVSVLQSESGVFMDRIFSSVRQLPYCLLYMAKVLKSTLHAKFPTVAEKDVLKAVGSLVYHRFINPAIIAPDCFDVISVPTGETLSSDQRRNLGSIAKVLQFAAGKRGFGVEATHLHRLNPFLVAAHERFKSFLLECCGVEQPEAHYGRHQFSETTMLARPTISITAAEICQLHAQLLAQLSVVAPRGSEDPLQQLLQQLGPTAPSVEQLIGAAGGDHKERAEIVLSLDGPPSLPLEDSQLSEERVFVQCKHLLIDVIRCGDDVDVASCARREPTALQERSFRQLLEVRGVIDSCSRRRRNQLRRQHSSAHMFASLEETKDELMQRLRLLERAGRVSRADDYAALLRAIVDDIVRQRDIRQRRRCDLAQLRATIVALEKKRTHYQEQAAFYGQYLEQCLYSMRDKCDKVGKHAKDCSGDSATNHTSKTAEKGVVLRYTAAKLAAKEVLISVDGSGSSSELRSINVELTRHTDEGSFVVTARVAGVYLEQTVVKLSELLRLQYDGVTTLRACNRLVLSVHKLIALINNKFYGKKSK